MREHDAPEEKEIVLVPAPGLGNRHVQLGDQFVLDPREVALDHAGVTPGVIVLARSRSDPRRVVLALHLRRN